MKLYDQNEIGAILKKAAENSSVEDQGTRIGLSRDELNQLAADVGIDPSQIARAIADIESESSQRNATFLGGPFAFSRQVIVDGEISTSQWEEMLISIREFFQSKGEVSSRDSVLEWSSPRGTTNSAQVTVLKDRGKTRISMGWNGPLTALPFYLPLPFAVVAFVFFASEFLELSAVPGIALTVLLSGLAFLVARWAVSRHLDNGFSKLNALMNTLETIATDGIQMSTVEASTSSTPLGKVQSQESSIESSTLLHDDVFDSETPQRGRSRA